MVTLRPQHPFAIFCFSTSVTLAGPGPELKKRYCGTFVRGLFYWDVVDFLGQNHDVLLS